MEFHKGKVIKHARCSAPAGIDSCGKSVTLIDNFKAVEKEIW